MKTKALCWFDGAIVAASEARVSVFDHGLLYGDGVFEGLRFYHGRVFRLRKHLERLQQSADAIGLELPLGLEGITAAIDELVDSYPGDSGYLRLVVTRGAGSLGIDPRSCAQPLLFIIADALQVVSVADPQQGICLHVASTRRLPSACLDPRIKSLNYLNNILARIEANRAGADEALMLNLDGRVVEGSVDNLFIVRGGLLSTPAIDDGLLGGITRAVVLEVARDLGIETRETSLAIEDLYAADECFLTGTGAELIPVRQIGEHRYTEPERPLYPLILRGFQDRVASECRNG